MASKLDIDVKNAKALNLSYGYYKAMQYDPNAASAKRKKTEKICPVCGNPVCPPKIKFCSDECAKINVKEYHRKKYLEKCHRNGIGV